jgi:hypothetical protein
LKIVRANQAKVGDLIQRGCALFLDPGHPIFSIQNAIASATGSVVNVAATAMRDTGEPDAGSSRNWPSFVS